MFKNVSQNQELMILSSIPERKTPNNEIEHTISGTHCKTFWSKLRGLMFSRPKVLIFHFEKPVRVSLHMFFVFFPINVIFLDSKKKVIEIKENFRPFTFYASKHKAVFVIEAPTGFVKEKPVRIGDTASFS